MASQYRELSITNSNFEGFKEVYPQIDEVGVYNPANDASESKDNGDGTSTLTFATQTDFTDFLGGVFAANAVVAKEMTDMIGGAPPEMRLPEVLGLQREVAAQLSEEDVNTFWNDAGEKGWAEADYIRELRQDALVGAL